MKKQLFKLLAIGMVAILVLGACSSGKTSPAEVAPTAAEVEGANLTDAEMEALITEKIKDKHTLAFILEQDMTAEEWSETIDRMIKYGAEISAEEKTLIIDWLVSRKK